MKISEIGTLVTVATAVAAAIIYFTPIRVFEAKTTEFNKRIVAVEVAVNKINTAKLKAMLRKLKAKYGHTDCFRMEPNDEETCNFIKESLDQFG